MMAVMPAMPSVKTVPASALRVSSVSHGTTVSAPASGR
jgi:hypothetical protein